MITEKFKFGSIVQFQGIYLSPITLIQTALLLSSCDISKELNFTKLQFISAKWLYSSHTYFRGLLSKLNELLVVVVLVVVVW